MKEGVRDNSDDMPLQGGYVSVAPIADTDAKTSSRVPTNGLDTNCISLAANPTSWNNSVDCDSLMRKAYDTTLIQSGSCTNTDWHRIGDLLFTIPGIFMYYQVVLLAEGMLIYLQKKYNIWLWGIFLLSMSSFLVL